MKSNQHHAWSFRRTVVGAAVLCVCIGGAQAQYNNYPPADSSGGKGGWLAVALLPEIGRALIMSATQGAGCVFSRFFNWLGAGTAGNYACANPMQQNQMVPNNAGFNGMQQPYMGQQPMNQMPYQQQQQFQQPMQQAVQPQPAPPAQDVGQVPAPQMTTPTAGAVTPDHAAQLAKQPVLSFIIDRLASADPNAAVLNNLATSDLVSGNEPSFIVQTGWAFAVRFATSVPGRVRLVNVDAEGQRIPSSIYEALPQGDNRMPRAHEGGILMEGKPGTEYLEFEFVPCISPSLSKHPQVAPFAGQLPACSTESATKQWSVGAGDKAMRFPPNSDPTQPVAIAPTNHVKGEQLRFRVRIDHVGPV